MSGPSLQVLEHVADASVRALLLAAVAWPASRLVRGAAARHAIWFTLLAAMLALPFLSSLLPSLRPEIVARYTPPLARFELSGSRAASPAPVGAASHAGHPPVPQSPRWPVAISGIYALAALFLLARFSWVSAGPADCCATLNPSAKPVRAMSWKTSPPLNPCPGPSRDSAPRTPSPFP